MAGYSFVRKGEEGEAFLDGALRVENAAEIRMKLLEMMEEEEGVLLTIGEDAETDLSFLQILCSAHRTAAGMNKPFRIAPLNPGAFMRRSAEAGFIGQKGCSFDIHGDCIRVSGGRT